MWRNKNERCISDQSPHGKRCHQVVLFLVSKWPSSYFDFIFVCSFGVKRVNNSLITSGGQHMVTLHRYIPVLLPYALCCVNSGVCDVWEVTQYTLICLAFHLPCITVYTVALGFMLLCRLFNDAVPVA